VLFKLGDEMKLQIAMLGRDWQELLAAYLFE
jgi:hypothetical protein